MFLFGSCGGRLINSRLLTAKEFPRGSCFFIGYGTDSHGYRVVILDGSVMPIEVGRDFVIISSRSATEAFVAKWRSDPGCGHVFSWIDILLRPLDMFSTRSDLGYNIESFPRISLSIIVLFMFSCVGG